MGKLYKLYHQAVSGPVKELLFPWCRENFYKSFWAVRDVDIEIRKGEIVGVIGPNGSGKTTLLKMIAGLLPVDQGSLSVRGRVTALLALGVGVHPEFSGRENAYFNGLLLGMSRQEINAKMEKIIAFAEIGEFIDQPFRTYSAGMKARLLFSVAMSVNPEIMIVDEALATGDAYFLSKSKRKIKELCSSGATVLFVSHNMEQIAELCSRALLMIKGKIKKIGKPGEIIEHYNKHCLTDTEKQNRKKHKQNLPLLDGNGDIKIKRITLLDKNAKKRTSYRSGEKAIIRITFTKSKPGPLSTRVWIGFIDSETSEWVSEIGSKTEGNNLPVHFGWCGGYKKTFFKNFTTLDFILSPLQIQYGNFNLWVTAINNKKETLFEYKNIIKFKVGGRIQSIINPRPKFWHQFKVKAVK